MPEQRFDDEESSEPDDRDVFYDTPDAEEREEGLPAGSAADVLVGALFEAGPEAAEHLLKAAQELLLAAKAVVDAGERVIDQRRRAAGDEQETEEQPRVRRIDLA